MVTLPQETLTLKQVDLVIWGVMKVVYQSIIQKLLL